MNTENVFKQTKAKLDAREVVRDEIGEPAIKSAETWKWHSPFRIGDSDPSLCADKKQIKDFGRRFLWRYF